MTHYSVLVRIPAKTPNMELSGTLAKMMEPWQEHSCTGRCPIEFMEFEDKEAEYLEEFETGVDEFVDATSIEDALESATSDAINNRERDVVIHNGRYLVRSWHDAFRVPGSLGIGSGAHKVPDDLPRVQVPFREIHSTLEDFARDYHHDARDEVKGRYGFWENPNHKWDYWRPQRRVLVRSSGGPVECARISALDGDAIAAKTKVRADEVWEMIDAVRAGRGKSDQPFWDIDARGVALDYGVLTCVFAEEMTPEIEERYRCVSQGRRDELKVYDCWDDRMTRERFDEVAIGKCHPLSTWARLERKEGGWGGTEWTEPGRVGWWGSHGATADGIADYSKAFLSWLAGGDREDFVTVLDCHT